MESISAIILAGGKGIRLKKLFPYFAKPLVNILDKPFIFYLIKQLNNLHFQNIVISVYNYLDQFEDFFTTYCDIYPNLTLMQEPFELGTGGALAYCSKNIKTKYILVLNGDTISKIDINDMLNHHINNKSLITIGVSNVDDTSRFGAINFNEKYKVISFNEKSLKEIGYVNTGYIIFNTSLLQNQPIDIPFSVDSLIKKFISSEDVYVYINKNDFIDIGTPSDFFKAENFIINHNLS